MRLYRIASETPLYAAADLSGGGAASVGGRWNGIGRPIVYTTTTRSLAYLKILAHLLPTLQPFAPPPGNLCLIEVEVRAAVWDARKSVRNEPLFPGGWDVHPPGKSSIDFGNAWLAARSSALLVVPSVVVPDEDNILINPRHPDSAGITAKNTGAWTFDRRLFA